MVFIVALLLFCSLVSFRQQCHCFQFVKPSLLPPVKAPPFLYKTSEDTAQNMKKTLQEKLLRMNESFTNLNKQSLDKVNHQVEHMRKDMKKTEDKFTSMKEELAQTTNRLQRQCLWIDRMNTELQHSLRFDGYPVLTFEDADISSIFGNVGLATNAIDGNLNTNLKEGSCAHTGTGDPTSWWLGVLPQQSEIHRIQLIDRTDCCSGRLNNIEVQVFETDPRQDTDAEAKLCQTISTTTEFLVNVTCDSPLTGKYIRVLKTTKQVFHLCEVRAFGYTDSSQKFGKAMQSSGVAEAQLAVDGDPTTCSETLNEDNTWWQVDLLGETTVTGLTLTNRDDKKYTFLSNFEVTVSKNLPSVCVDSTSDICTSFKGTVGQGESVTLTCEKPMTGCYLRINKMKGGPLSLCGVSLVNEKK